MSIFRCAACGSQNVSTDTQTAGIKYDYVKGTVGTVLLGTGGAVAGITNKEQRVYKCSDCGMTLSYPMPESIKTMIDEGVVFSEKREHLYLKGVLVSWSELKGIYKNIESGPADVELEQRAAIAKNKELRGIEILKMNGTASAEEFNNSISILSKYKDKFDVDSILKEGSTPFGSSDQFSEKNPPSLFDYLSLLSALDVFFSNYFRFRPYKQPKDEEGKLYKTFLIIYISLDYYKTTNMYPYVKGPKEKLFIDFIEHNSFYYQLLVFFAKFLCPTEQEDFLMKGDTHQVLFTLAQPGISGCRLIYPCSLSNSSEALIFPKYKIENGALHYNNLAFEVFIISFGLSRRKYDFTQHTGEYFKCFPNQKEKYELDVSEHNKSIELTKTARERVDNKKKDLKAAIANANKQISEYNSEIYQLSKKVFGKKKAEERKQELLPVIKQQQDIIAKLDAEYAQLERISIPEPESDSAFIERMNKEYDYFLIWYRIDESGTKG